MIYLSKLNSELVELFFIFSSETYYYITFS
jgi:hypothetical protein